MIESEPEEQGAGVEGGGAGGQGLPDVGVGKVRSYKMERPVSPSLSFIALSSAGRVGAK